jgi:hypothetical protein
MYIVDVGTNEVDEFTLSTAWDISTLSHVTQFSVASQDTDPTGIYFKDDGTKMYIIGYSSDAVYQYTTEASAPATVTYPSSVKWSGATTPDAPAGGEKDLYVFVTTDGGTTYYGKQAGDALA